MTYGDGHEERFRLVPGIAASGWVVTPALSDAWGFALFASGRSDESALRPRAVAIEADALGGAAYEPEIDVSWRTVDAKRLAAKTTLPPALAARWEASANLVALSKSVPPSPRVRMMADGCESTTRCLFAHAPAELELAVKSPGGGARRGLRPGAGRVGGERRRLPSRSTSAAATASARQPHESASSSGASIEVGRGRSRRGGGARRARVRSGRRPRVRDEVRSGVRLRLGVLVVSRAALTRRRVHSEVRRSFCRGDRVRLRA